MSLQVFMFAKKQIMKQIKNECISMLVEGSTFISKEHTKKNCLLHVIEWVPYAFF